jgi:hypothetical protein
MTNYAVRIGYRDMSGHYLTSNSREVVVSASSPARAEREAVHIVGETVNATRLFTLYVIRLAD